MLTINHEIETQAEKVVEFYHMNETDIRKVCEPHWCLQVDEHLAQQAAALELFQKMPVDHLTAYLLVGMWFDEHPH